MPVVLASGGLGSSPRSKSDLEEGMAPPDLGLRFSICTQEGGVFRSLCSSGIHAPCLSTFPLCKP